MNPTEKASAILKLEQAIAVIQALPASTPCAECNHFKHAGNWCQFYSSAVPKENQPSGCNNWGTSIPF